MFSALEHDFFVVFDLFGVGVDIALVEEFIGVDILLLVVLVLWICLWVFEKHVVEEGFVDVVDFNMIELDSFLDVVV